MSLPRLLYLGYALPPGVSVSHPELVTGGELIEPNMVRSLDPWFEIRSVGVFNRDLSSIKTDPEASIGLAHSLQLLDRSPALITRWQSLRRLQRQYLHWVGVGWKPDCVLVCCFAPVYSTFVRWLRKRRERPTLVLFLTDAPTLGESIPAGRRWRYRFKPMAWFEDQMLDQFDACVGVSVETEQYFQRMNRPWYWYPGGLDPNRALRGRQPQDADEIVFGYLGSLSDYGGLPDFLRVFESLKLPSQLYIAGSGRNQALVEERCRQNPRLRYAGKLTPDDALSFAQRCDILANPRTVAYGNRNNFPMKVFDYALAGRSILSGRLSGAESVLGPDAFYFDHNDFDRSLAAALRKVVGVSREELHARGVAIQRRLLDEFKWSDRAPGLADFLRRQTEKRSWPQYRLPKETIQLFDLWT